MMVSHMNDMKKGWFIGDFEPSILKTNNVEVAVKRYSKGERENKHYHKIATEYTVVALGKVRMNGIIYTEGDIVVMEPGEVTDFEALTETVNVVVKIPSVNNDKFEVR